MKNVRTKFGKYAEAKVGDWLKDADGGYWQVVQITPENTVIKMGFDYDLTYVKQTVRVSCFHIRLTDLKDFQPLTHRESTRIKKFFSRHPEEEKSFSKQTENMLFFREQIHRAGFEEAYLDFMQFNFFRRTTEKAAFILNLQDLGEYIRIVYGFTSISDEEFFEKNGEVSSVIKLRYMTEIRSEKDEVGAANAIKTIFDLYRNSSKDEILAFKRERQKAFLYKITEKLKPFGFKKKGSIWTKTLDNGFSLEFYAQKSQWSDEYYFNVSLYPTLNKNAVCYQTRFMKNKKGIFDWQLMDDEDFNDLMGDMLESVLLPIINT